MPNITLLSNEDLDIVSGGRVRGGRGGDAIAVSAAVIFVGDDVDDSTLTATSGNATATGGRGGDAED